MTVYDSTSNQTLNTHRASGMPNIGANGNGLAVTSTNVAVYSNNMKIGFIQSASPSESRNIVKIQELGTEGVIQSVPSNTNGGQISVTRFALYNSNMYNALGLTRTGGFVARDQINGTQRNSEKSAGTYAHPFKTLKDQRVPLELQVKTSLPNGQTFVETYLDCWLSSYSKTIASNTITITEQGTIQYSDVVTSQA